MKIITLVSLGMILSTISYGQSDPSKTLPPIDMLPKEGKVKQIYELPAKTDYKIYNSDVELFAEGNAQFIDYTKYKKGTYFILYDGKKEAIVKE